VPVLKRLLSSFDETLLYRLFRESFRSQARNYVYAIIAMIVVAATTAGSAWIMRDIVNEMVISKNIEKVFAIAVAIAAIFVGKGVATYGQSYYLSKAGNRIIADAQKRLFDHYLAQGAGFFEKVVSSDLLIRITHNAQAARAIIDTIVVSFARDLFTLIGLVLVMVLQQPMLALLSLAFGPLALIGVRALLRKARKYMTQELTSLGHIVQTVQETTAGIRVIKAFSLENLLRGRMDKAVRDVEKQANRIARLEAATSPIMETLAGLAIASMLALSGVLVLKYGQTPGELMSFITALLLAYEPAKRLARMRVSIETGMVGVRAMFELLDHPLTIVEAPDAQPLPDGPGEVRLERLTFSYRDGHPILRNVDLVFPAGRTTALVGHSGAGKSTIINLVMRLYDPDKGRVTIDGHDLRRVTFESLRDRIAYVGQDAFLFAGTIRHNIALGRRGATEADIEAAARAANAHDFITAMPQGYDTEVGEGGGRLSGGQRQRVTIARAILRGAPILILDEPTSALDSESEGLIRDALEQLSVGRTTIVIAHRLSTVASADHIIVMERGRVAEQGGRDELLRRNGPFQRLFGGQLLSMPTPGPDDIARDPAGADPMAGAR